MPFRYDTETVEGFAQALEISDMFMFASDVDEDDDA